MLTFLVLVTLTQTQPLDAAPFRDKLTLLTDGKGHYVAVDEKDPMRATFYGDGKTFAQLRIASGGRNGDESWNISFWDPRAFSTRMSHPEVAMRERGKTYTAFCRDRQTTLTPVPAAEAKALLDEAAFTTSLWWRRPEKLLRDDTGTYYFIDRFRSDDNERRDFRVFVGRKGAMKQLPLKEVVDDSQGMIFATKTGDLRLVTREGQLEGKWVKGKATTALVEVSLDSYETARLVYLELGPYAGQRLGTPCDDLL